MSPPSSVLSSTISFTKLWMRLSPPLLITFLPHYVLVNPIVNPLIPIWVLLSLYRSFWSSLWAYEYPRTLKELSYLVYFKLDSSSNTKFNFWEKPLHLACCFLFLLYYGCDVIDSDLSFLLLFESLELKDNFLGL